MKPLLSHVDLRVRDRERAKAFYTLLLGALGHGGTAESDEWTSFWQQHDGVGDWFAFAEDKDMEPGTARVALRADSREDVDRVGKLLRDIGAENIEGPSEAYGPSYYAVFFTDPDGNKLEVCCVARP